MTGCNKCQDGGIMSMWYCCEGWNKDDRLKTDPEIADASFDMSLKAV